MISERTKAALAAAKARGTKLGIRTRHSLAGHRERAEARYGCPDVIEDINATGIRSARQIAKALNERGTWWTLASREQRVISRTTA